MFSQMSVMQSMFAAILLPFLLIVCLSLQPVAGEDLQVTYNNCTTCYQTLADALINTGNNKYQLSRGFFPPDDAPPVLVKATYHFQNCSNKTWYWTEGAFYIYQPLRVFVFRSLFFSHISILQETVELQLPAECCDAPYDYFEFLTQRLKAYAAAQTANPPMDNMYYAKAVNGVTELDYENHEVYGYADGVHIDRLLHAYQYVPFILTFLIVSTAPTLLCCLCCTCKGMRENISRKVKTATKNNRDQAVIVATVTICSCGTVYNFVLDIISSHMDDQSDLPGYYKQNQGIYVHTLLFTIISLLFLIVGILWLVGIWLYYKTQLCKPNDQNTKTQVREKLEKGKQHFALLIPIVLCVGSFVLSLSFHFQNIIIAWTTDPFYASRIAVYYGIIVFVYYLTFKNTYMIPLVCKKELTPAAQHNHSLNTTASQSPPIHQQTPIGSQPPIDTPNDAEVQTTSFNGSQLHTAQSTDTPTTDEKVCVKSNGDKEKEYKMRASPRDVCLGITCVVIVGILLAGFHALNAVFIYYIPINNSIETSVHGVQTIYNGAVILIGGLIAYNVGWSFYHTRKFSVEEALKKAMKDLDEDPFGNVEKGWGHLSEQDRMKHIMKALLINEARKVKE